jgi:hypothetical protein
MPRGNTYHGGDLSKARRSTLWNLAQPAVKRAAQSQEDNAQLAEDVLRRVREQGLETIERSELIDWAQVEIAHRTGAA